MLIRRPNPHETGDPGGGAHHAFRVIAAETCMGEADPGWPFDRHHQPRRIEKRLRKNESLQRRPVAKLDAAPAQKRLVPNLDQAWRVVVAKIAVLDHEAIPSRPVVWALLHFGNYKSEE
jgi:hypothetical protein